MPKKYNIMLTGVLGALLILGACAHTEPFEYESYNEVKPGPGVFTGEKGTWTIYRQEMPAESQAAPAEDNRDQIGDEAPADRSASGAAPAPN
ncbi:MAG: hypothetical protein PVG19_02570 [Desulfobacterales bacterium]|jgi:hypothetical protein